MPLDTAEITAKALAEKTAKAKKALNASKTQTRTKTDNKPKKAGKPRLPKLHRPKKESTKTITTRLYKTWAAIVKFRFDDKCAICGVKNSPEHPLNAHHIMPRQNFSGLRFHPKNGIALCPKCHKLGKYSAHKGGIWFGEWLRQHDHEAYEFCLSHHSDELDCKDRLALYTVEANLHRDYGYAVSYLDSFRVTAYDRKGNKVESLIPAYNNRAAEYIFWENWPKGEGYEKLKGIHKCVQGTYRYVGDDDHMKVDQTSHACPVTADTRKYALTEEDLARQAQLAVGARMQTTTGKATNER